jgi:hypothetical protein
MPVNGGDPGDSGWSSRDRRANEVGGPDARDERKHPNTHAHPGPNNQRADGYQAYGDRNGDQQNSYNTSSPSPNNHGWEAYALPRLFRSKPRSGQLWGEFSFRKSRSEVSKQ